MRYLILVSHGTFAPGLHNALGMMAGSDREDIRSTSLLDGMDVDTFRANFTELVKDITAEDEIILTADIIGGSPLTHRTRCAHRKGSAGQNACHRRHEPAARADRRICGCGDTARGAGTGTDRRGQGPDQAFDFGGDEDDDI